MAITFIAENKRVKYLLGGLGIVLFGALLFFGVGFLQSQSLSVGPPAVSLGTIKIDLTILDHPIFEYLNPPEDPIPPPEEVGRENPFLPLDKETTAAP